MEVTGCASRCISGKANAAIKKIIILFILFLTVLGLHCSLGFFPSCGMWGYSLGAVHRLLIVMASLAAEQGL